ncbi:hypothetical protein ACLBXM_19995 [Xanthobacteraceae bacterium A53D]
MLSLIEDVGLERALEAERLRDEIERLRLDAAEQGHATLAYLLKVAHREAVATARLKRLTAQFPNPQRRAG